MALGDLIKTMKKPHSIMGDLDRYLLKLQGREYLSDEDNGREKGVWSPSEVSTVDCIRALTFKWLNTPKSEEQQIRPQIRRLFDVGHHFGYQMQGYFWDMGILLGKWKCTTCKHKWKDLDNPSPRKCPNCGVKSRLWYNLRYDEVDIRIPRGDKPPVAGHADGLILDPKSDSGKRVLELKTIKSAEDGWTPQMKAQRDFFQKLNEPLEKHLNQLNLYQQGIGVDEGVVLYGNKNDQQVKEYLTKKMDFIVERQFLKMEQTERAIDQEYLPERISDNKDCAECKWCSWKSLCHGKELTFKEVDNRKKEEVINATND